MRLSSTVARGLALLSACSAPAISQILPSPPGNVTLYSSASNGANNNSAVPAGCAPYYSVSTATSAAISRTCDYIGPITSAPYLTPFSVGTIRWSGSGEVTVGGQLHAASSASGVLAAGDALQAQTQTHYWDLLTVTGPTMPAQVIFELSIHGSFTRSGNFSDSFSDWADVNNVLHPYAGRVDLGAEWQFDRQGNPVAGTSWSGVLGKEDGSTSTGFFSVPWSSYSYNHSMMFDVGLVAFGRAYSRSSSDEVFSIDTDYWAQVDNIRVLDAAGNDVTATDGVSLASGMPLDASTAPEPGSLLLTASALAALLAFRNRRRAPHGAAGHRRPAAMVLGAAVVALSGASRTASAQGIRLPQSSAVTFSSAENADGNHNAVPAGCEAVASVVGTASGSISRTCAFTGQITGQPYLPPFSPGNVTSINEASFAPGGELYVHNSTFGLLNAQTALGSNHAEVHYYDALTVTGQSTPAAIVLDLSLRGTSTSSGSFTTGITPWYDAAGTAHPGLARMNVYALQSSENASGFREWGVNGVGSSVVADGVYGYTDGSDARASFTIPWTQYAIGQSLAFELTLFANGAVYNGTDTASEFALDREYWAQIDDIRVIDGSGTDVTALDQVSLASDNVSSTPEPSTLVLAGTVLMGAGLLRRRRRES